MKFCDITCSGAPEQICGGTNAYSAYIGQKYALKLQDQFTPVPDRALPPSDVCINFFTHFLFTATCPENQIRFGSYCYFELATASQGLFENANECEDNEALLWYPETEAEIKFVQGIFPTQNEDDVYHLGVKSYNRRDGLTFIDNTTIPGSYAPENLRKVQGQINL